MIDALYIAATGMHAQQTNVDTISNNLANVNTPAYKKTRISFQDIFYKDIGTTSPEMTSDISQKIGSGVGLVQLGKLFQDGDLKKTDSNMDVAIQGKGFFEVVLPDGTSAYTRAGTLQITKEGLLANSDGYILKQAIQIPADASDMTIDATGKVLVTVPKQKDKLEAGQIELVNFVNLAGLAPLGDNLYAATEKAGDMITGLPNQDGLGKLAQGYLESSNVKLVDELTNLILAQRAYEMNAKSIQAADEMLSISNNLRR